MIPSIKLSPKERRKYYRRVMENKHLCPPNCFAAGNGVCQALHNSFDLSDKIKFWAFEDLCTSIFPELGLFKDKLLEPDRESYWLNGTDRYLVLAFCIELTKEKSK